VLDPEAARDPLPEADILAVPDPETLGAAEVEARANPFPIELVVTQLEVAGVEKGAAGVIEFPTVKACAPAESV